MSLNLSQIFVRYPAAPDAAEVLRDFYRRSGSDAAGVVASTGSPWLAVCGTGNETSPEAAQALSRALEAQAVWAGLAGHTLAYRLIRYELGREAERVLVPAEIFEPAPPKTMPDYRDVEQELYRKLRDFGIPADYIYLFVEEIGVAGGDPGTPDAAAARRDEVGPFRHRVPKRGVDRPRTLFDVYREGEQSVTESLRLHGPYDEARARALLAVLDAMRRRRSLPEGWTLRYEAASPGDTELIPRLAALHAKGGHLFEFGTA